LVSFGGWIITKKKALFFTLWLYTFLLWLYIVARIVIDQVGLDSLFLNQVPFFTFIRLGIVAFVLSMIFLYMFLAAGNIERPDKAVSSTILQYIIKAQGDVLIQAQKILLSLI